MYVVYNNQRSAYVHVSYISYSYYKNMKVNVSMYIA